jgi:hypothetical protein
MVSITMEKRVGSRWAAQRLNASQKDVLMTKLFLLSLDFAWARRTRESGYPDPVRDWEKMRVLQHSDIACPRVDTAKERMKSDRGEVQEVTEVSKEKRRLHLTFKRRKIHCRLRERFEPLNCLAYTNSWVPTDISTAGEDGRILSCRRNVAWVCFDAS